MLCVDDLQWVGAETVTLLQMLEVRWRIPSLGIGPVPSAKPETCIAVNSQPIFAVDRADT